MRTHMTQSKLNDDYVASTIACLLRAGDRVVLNMSQEARLVRGLLTPPDGTLGTVTGHYDVLRYRHRYGFDLYFYTPGVYKSRGAAYVLWDGSDTPVTVNDSDISLADVEEWKRRYREEWFEPIHVDKLRGFIEHENLLSGNERVGDLPEPAFYEMDSVRIDPKLLVDDHTLYTNSEGQEMELRVTAIDYGFEYRDGDVGNHYQLTRYLKQTGEHARAGSISAREDQLILESRGNVWRHYHGEACVFRSLREEADFARGMARVRDVPHPHTRLYAWTVEEALAAMRRGEIDGMGVESDAKGLMFGRSVEATHVAWAYRFDDRDLGERVRKVTLDGFAP